MSSKRVSQIFLGPTLRLVCMVWGVTIRCWRGRRSFPSAHSTSQSKHWGRQSGSSWRRNCRAHTPRPSASGSGESQHSSASSSWSGFGWGTLGQREWSAWFRKSGLPWLLQKTRNSAREFSSGKRSCFLPIQQLLRGRH